MKTGAVAIAAPRNRLADFVALTKPRLNSLVVVTTGVGYLAGRVEGFDPVVFAHTTIGAALVAGGAAALNQIAEHDLDERMLRARDRPTPAGRLHQTEATWFAVLLAGAGLAQLAFGANLTAAVVVFATLVSYAGIYTPSKRRTHWAVLVGAVPGALPVVIGWAPPPVRCRLTPGRCSLLPSCGSCRTSCTTILTTGPLLLATRFAADRSTDRARVLFRATLLYLPLVLGLLLVDATG